MPVYGRPLGKALTSLTDTWATQATLAHLVREAACHYEVGVGHLIAGAVVLGDAI